MDKMEYIIGNYWFESFEEMIDILEHWEREDKENNLFFENAIDCIKSIYEEYCKLEEQHFKSIQTTWILLWKYGEWAEKVERENTELLRELHGNRKKLKNGTRFLDD